MINSKYHEPEQKTIAKLFLLPACLNPFYGSRSCFPLVMELRPNYQTLLQCNPLTFVNFSCFHFFFHFSFSRWFSWTFSSLDFFFFWFPLLTLFIPQIHTQWKLFPLLSDCQLLKIYINSVIPFLPLNLYLLKRGITFPSSCVFSKACNFFFVHIFCFKALSPWPPTKKP